MGWDFVAGAEGDDSGWDAGVSMDGADVAGSTGMGGVDAAAWLLARFTSATSGALAATGGPLAIGFTKTGGTGIASRKRSDGAPMVAR